MNRNYLFIVLLISLLYSCSSPNTLYVENNFSTFPSSNKIFIETDSEIVPLSSRLRNSLHRAKFLTTDERKNADYILKFDYTARFDDSPWVFTSFNLTMTDTYSNNILYKITTDNFKSEPVDSLISRTVSDMSSRLLVNPMKGRPALIIK